MEMFEQFIHDTIEKLDLKLTDEERKKYEALMLQVFEKGVNPKDAMGFSDEMIEHMYAHGFRLFNSGSYQEANDTFNGLHALVPDDNRFLLALAASYHRLMDYGSAARHYYQLGMREHNNPIPFYYMYDCYYNSGYLSDAGISLAETIRRCGDQPMYAKIKERSILMLKNLDQEIKQLRQDGDLIEEDLTETIPEEFREIINKKEIS